ncbi:MAG: aminopeptidase [Bacteroidetes bacterium GWF2_41_61]|nr:MAG: aminopeptidase [Bacteroidetes bacterium GWE2_40_15]OFY36768.1 MAG: aminopeptidase [Bacteroidetes bacterium GWF2_41_61]OFY91717.1 MAG: aminopeptidase [Bacteroidetes bacterium RIFOXYA12_FULL_40_10]HBG23845.1 aminopeptidase [Rikenellaceae bacterium]HBZ25826.1 aminopeptidase [Rikenellaceae bacterium]
MKKLLSGAILFAFFLLSLNAQEKTKTNGGYQFNVVKELPVTSVKNQSRTSTCWSFSAISFLESELIRLGKGEHNLSEMFIVSNAYFDKADKYIRTSGNINFAPGSSFGDALTIWKSYGIVPDNAMPGLNYGENIHIHNEMDAALSGYINALLKNPNGKYSTAWKDGFRGILDAYLGKVPQKFSYNGKEYTPKSFAAELGIVPEDYVSITSYNHHPFYGEFALEIPDNWRWDRSYNLPIEEFMQIFDFAIEKGFTVLWGSDVSEKGFTRRGVAIVPETEVANMSGSDQQRWLGVTKSEIDAKFSTLEQIVPEKVITQNDRQISFDNGQTTDDHGMHIYGVAKDQNGNKYYLVKNSWGETGDYKGIWYVSETFVKYKTMNIVVHKNSIPANIKSKLGIK